MICGRTLDNIDMRTSGIHHHKINICRGLLYTVTKTIHFMLKTLQDWFEIASTESLQPNPLKRLSPLKNQLRSMVPSLFKDISWTFSKVVHI